MMNEERKGIKLPGTAIMEIYLDSDNARRLLEGKAGTAVEASLDLNLSRRSIPLEGGSFRTGEDAVPLEPLHEIARAARKAFRAVSGASPVVWSPLEVFAGRHHQLVPTPGAPTIEIDGVQMHRTSGIDPFESAREAAASVVRAGDRVLDTCGGLGYTAIHAARRGAAEVMSAEVNEAVLELRALNPWSREEQDLPIRLSPGDALALLSRLEPGSIDAVIHDPPRFSLAPELYSETFYVRLRDVLRPGGRLFHYTGSPYSRGRGREFLRGVVDRLRRAGFSMQPRDDLQGFVCRAPGSTHAGGGRRR